MWYDHQFLRLRDTFAKKSKAWQKCASFSRFTDLCGKKSKNKQSYEERRYVLDNNSLLYSYYL